MAYCRFSNADVYVFHNTDDKLECCGCSLTGDAFATPDFYTNKRSEMITHLGAHQVAGDFVPEYVFEQLEDEKLTDGDRL